MPETVPATASPAVATATPVLDRNTPTVTPASIPDLTPTAEISPLVVTRLETPTRIETGRSAVVTVSLIRGEGDVLTPVVQTPGNIVVVATPRPLGTPGPIEDALGPGYRARARGVLNAPPLFNPEPANHEFRELLSSRVDWSWTLSPEGQGTQTLLLLVEVEWTSESGIGSPIIEPIFSQSFEIEVTKPFITFGQFQIGTLLMGSLGSVFSASFIFTVWKEAKKRAEADRRGDSLD